MECGAKEAAASLRRMAFNRGQGRCVKLTTDPTQDTYDRYRRLLAYVETNADRQLNVSQIAYGWRRPTSTAARRSSKGRASAPPSVAPVAPSAACGASAAATSTAAPERWA